MIPFELAGGSIVGRDHRVVSKNNQDAYHISSNESAIVAVVCDGCGSGTHSEIGAAIGARLLCQSIHAELAHGNVGFRWWRVERDILSSIHVLVTSMGGNYRETIEDYFLFTVIGVVVTPINAVFFGVGDGLPIYNGFSAWGGSWPGNAPPYLCYQLLNTERFTPYEIQIQILTSVPVDDLDNFLIGCDGAGRPGLLQVCEEDRKLPGMEKTVGPISQFWEEDMVFSNPVALSRRLKLIARDWPPRDPEHGLLADDTTIVVGRRTYVP